MLLLLHKSHSHAWFPRYAQKKADEMKAISLQSALDTVETLEIKLTDFAKKHQSEIQNDPVFRQRCVYADEINVHLAQCCLLSLTTR